MTKKSKPTQKQASQPKQGAKRRGRPVTNDIMNLQGSIPVSPEELAKIILSTPPSKIKK